MRIKSNLKDHALNIKVLEKRMDSGNAGNFKAEFLVLLDEKVKDIEIDLSSVEFCDSSGLSALLLLQRHTGQYDGVTTLVNCQENVMKLIKISKLDRVFELKP
jgi:anti-sigma B factor antagonist